MHPKKLLRQKRIFVGFNNAGAAGIWSFTRILRKRGYKVDFYGMGSTRLGMQVDQLLKFSDNKVLSFFQRIIFFFKILPKYQVWHLNFMEAFFFYPLNLLILKIFKKKIILTFRGVEVRRNIDFLPKKIFEKIPKEKWPTYYQKDFKYSSWKKFLKFLRVKIFCLFADKIILTGPFSAGQVPYFDQIIPYARKIGELEGLKKTTKKFKILHVPTEPIVKGTPEIKKIFQKLQKKYPKVEFEIIETMPHEDFLKHLAEANIVVDQIIVGWYGGQAVEAMAMGKIVMAYLHPAYLGLVPYGENVPIVNTNFWNLEKDLENLIKIYPQVEKDYKIRSLNYVKKYHDANKIADDYLKIYQEVM